MNFKEITIGAFIKQRVSESGIAMSRICNFMHLSEEQVLGMYYQKDLPTDLLLKWSKLLKYDFFRLYSQHLIFYAPPSGDSAPGSFSKSALPRFRKNMYTREIIDFILEEVSTGNKTKKQIIEQYKIPKTTLYKWIAKYKNELN